MGLYCGSEDVCGGLGEYKVGSCGLASGGKRREQAKLKEKSARTRRGNGIGGGANHEQVLSHWSVIIQTKIGLVRLS